MIPLALSYTRASSLDEALAAIRDGAKPIAGGQSLVPMMRLRLASPDGLVDLAGIAELTGIRREGGELVIGAMTRHRDVADSSDVQGAARVVAQAAAGIGSPAVRNRGTIAATPAIVNAAVDALTPLGIHHLEMPMQPHRVWEAIRTANQGAGS